MDYGKIDGKPLVTSGSLVVSHGQPAFINPFGTDDAFKLAFNFQLREEGGPETAIVRGEADVPTKTMVITFEATYRNGMHMCNAIPMVFASDDKHVYFGNFAANIIGEYSVFTAIVYYTLFSEERS